MSERRRVKEKDKREEEIVRGKEKDENERGRNSDRKGEMRESVYGDKEREREREKRNKRQK